MKKDVIKSNDVRVFGREIKNIIHEVTKDTKKVNKEVNINKVER